MTVLKETFICYNHIIEISKNQTQRLKCGLNTVQIEFMNVYNVKFKHY